MDLAILGGVLLIVAVAIAWDHARTLRRLRLARLLDDPRYGHAVELLWERQPTCGAYGAFLDALESLVERGIEREEARRNLTRIIGADVEVVRLALGRRQPAPAAQPLINPWDRRPTPASSSSFILPSPDFGRRSVASGPRA